MEFSCAAVQEGILRCLFEFWVPTSWDQVGSAWFLAGLFGVIQLLSVGVVAVLILHWAWRKARQEPRWAALVAIFVIGFALVGLGVYYVSTGG